MSKNFVNTTLDNGAYVDMNRTTDSIAVMPFMAKGMKAKTNVSNLNSKIKNTTTKLNRIEYTNERSHTSHVRSRKISKAKRRIRFYDEVISIIFTIGIFVGLTVLFYFLGQMEHPHTSIINRLSSASMQSILACFGLYMVPRMIGSVVDMWLSIKEEAKTEKDVY